MEIRINKFSEVKSLMAPMYGKDRYNYFIGKNLYVGATATIMFKTDSLLK